MEKHWIQGIIINKFQQNKFQGRQLQQFDFLIFYMSVSLKKIRHNNLNERILKSNFGIRLGGTAQGIISRDLNNKLGRCKDSGIKFGESRAICVNFSKNENVPSCSQHPGRIHHSIWLILILSAIKILLKYCILCQFSISPSVLKKHFLLIFYLTCLIITIDDKIAEGSIIIHSKNSYYLQFKLYAYMVFNFLSIMQFHIISHFWIINRQNLNFQFLPMQLFIQIKYNTVSPSIFRLGRVIYFFHLNLNSIEHICQIVIVIKFLQLLKVKLLMIHYKKKLAPILTSQVNRGKQPDADALSQLASSLRFLSDKIDSIFKNNRKNISSSNNVINQHGRMEERFQRVFQEVPKLPQLDEKSKEQRKHLIQLWLGKLCQQVFSITFSMFQFQKLNDKKAKAFCSQNMLSNLIKMIRQNNLTVEQISDINECLKNELIPYFLIKYPMSQQAEVNLQFANKIIQVDSIQKNQNDLIFRSKVNFNYREDGNYNEQIMRFINYIIQLPNQTLEDSEQTLFKQFYKDMQNFFKQIENQQFTIFMSKFDPRQPNAAINPNFIQNMEGKLIQGTLDKDSLEIQKQKLKYRENVKSYTKKLIGRKISENVKPFSQIQIKERDLRLKNPAVMRIITKWCQQLMSNFETKRAILNRQQQFRMKDGRQKILKRKHLLILSELLKKQKKKVNEYLLKVNQNNHQCQFDFGSHQVPKKMQKFSQQQSEVGLFAASLIRNYQTYLVGYVNTIIHSLMSATKDYEEMVKAYEYKQEQYGQSIDNWRKGKISFDDLINRAYSYRLASVPVSYISLVPSLVSFRVGDILRCKCTSKQKQIIALYAQLQKISRTPNSIMKIVRIKNRLQKGTKDILINLLYRDRTLIEMQLAVATTTSKFIDFSNKYNHILYELKRAEFGPISELCNIWINNDVKAGFYIQQSKDSNQRTAIHESITKHVCKGQKIKFPFRCSECSFFYNDTNYTLEHIFCSDQKCKKKVCSLCRAQKFNYDTLKANFNQIPSMEILEILPKQCYWEYKKRQSFMVDRQLKVVIGGLEGCGMLIDLKGDDRIPQYYKMIKTGKKYIVVQIRNIEKHDMKILKQLMTEDQVERFKKEYLIFNSNKLEELLQQIDGDMLNHYITQYNFPRYMKKCNLKQKSTIVFMDGGLDDANMKSFDFQFPYATKVCFYYNNLTNLEQIINKFDKCAIIDLGQNSVQKLNISHPQSQPFKSLKVLYLNYNKINDISQEFVKRLVAIQQLELASNKLKQLPDNFGILDKLKIINLSRNELKNVPQQVSELRNLQVLNIYNSKNQQIKLVELPQDIGNLKKLRKLNINFNNIQVLPDSFSQLQNLQVFYAVYNKMKSLPSDFGKLKQLKILNLAENNFDYLPEQIGELSSLQILNLEKATNQNKSDKILPDSFCNLKKLKMMDVSQNRLIKIPNKIGQMEELQTLFIYENDFKQIPESVKNLRHLRLLYASNNKFTLLPESICELQNLQKLTIKQNQLTKLPQDIGRLKKLKYLIGYENKIKVLPQSFGQLESLTHIYLKNNPIQHLPKSLKDLENIQLIQIDSGLLDTESRATLAVIYSPVHRNGLD